MAVKLTTTQQPLLSDGSVNMAVARQWLSSDHVGTPIYMNQTTAQQQRNGVFCMIRAEML
jgi:hypothetical protein